MIAIHTSNPYFCMNVTLEYNLLIFVYTVIKSIILYILYIILLQNEYNSLQSCIIVNGYDYHNYASLISPYSESHYYLPNHGRATFQPE